jgi:hypothetical protein
MTELLVPQLLEVLISSVSMDHTNLGQVSLFAADGRYYTFLINRSGLQRLAKQLERALREAPVSRRKRRSDTR